MKTIWWAHVPEIVHERWLRRDFSLCHVIDGGWENHGQIGVGTGDNPVTCLFCISARAQHRVHELD